MRATGFNHVSLVAHDLERSVRFYTEIFGMEKIATYTFAFPVQYLRLGDLQLHLFERDAPAPAYHHIGIDVDDYEEAYRRARELEILEKESFFSGHVRAARRQRPDVRARPCGQPRRARLARRVDPRPLGLPRDQEARRRRRADAGGAAVDAVPDAGMKPPPFAYHAPATVEETLGLLARRRRPRAGRRAEPRPAPEVPPDPARGARGHQRRRRPRRHRGARRRPAHRRPRPPAAAPGGRAPSRATSRCCARRRATSATPRPAGAARSAGRSRSARRGPSSRPPRSRSTRRSRCAPRGGDRADPGAGVLPRPQRDRARAAASSSSPCASRPGRGARARRATRSARGTATTRASAAAAVVDLDAAGRCRSATVAMLRIADRPVLLDCTDAMRDGGSVDGLARTGSRRPTTSRPAARTGGGSRRCSRSARCATRWPNARGEEAA